MEDYEKHGSGSSAENAVIGRSIVVRHLSVAVGAVALMPGVRFLDVKLALDCPLTK